MKLQHEPTDLYNEHNLFIHLLGKIFNFGRGRELKYLNLLQLSSEDRVWNIIRLEFSYS